jgi:hypothetical protein
MIAISPPVVLALQIGSRIYVLHTLSEEINKKA